MNLDFKTLFFTFGLICMVMALTLLFSFYKKAKKKEMILFVIILSLHSISTVLIGLREKIPDLISITLAQIMLITAFSIYYQAICRIFKFPVNKWLAFLPYLILPFSGNPEMPYIYRTLLVNSVYAFQHIIIIYILISAFKTKKTRAVFILLMCNTIAAFSFFFRSFTAVFFSEFHSSLAEMNFIQTVTFIMLFVSIIFLIIGILLLYLELEEEEIIQVNLLLKDQNLILQKKEKILYDNTLELKKVRNKALDANIAKSSFVANITHEIRTPMNSILGFCELLNYKITDPQHKHFLNAITVNGKILMSLFNNILDFSRLDSGGDEVINKPVEIKKLIKEMDVFFSESIKEKNIEFLIDVDDAMPEILETDPIKIRQILFNLISNAVKFTDEGKISLIAKSYPAEDKNSVTLELAVKDTGKGIDEKDQSLIFEPFIQIKEQKKTNHRGTGLGLTIIKKIISLMNGSISLESSVNKGSFFIVSIPDIRINKPN